MHMKMIRTIQPVGQGGFYTEIFKSDDPDEKDFCVVYDCGSFTGFEPKRTIPWAIPDGQDIDILFISHFDNDHINGIKELSKRRKIKTIIMPLLEKYVWFYLIEYYAGRPRVRKVNAKQILDLQKLISKLDTKIIEVAPFNPEDKSYSGNDNDSEILGQGGRYFVKSGYMLNPRTFSSYFSKSSNSSDYTKWLYIPINSANGELIEDLKSRLSGLFSGGIPGFKNFETLDASTCVKFITSSNQIRKDIKQIYVKVFGNANLSSMCVYSGALSDSTVWFNGFRLFDFPYFHHCHHLPDCDNREACLYTGDADLTDQSLKDHIIDVLSKQISGGPCLNHIGLMQIPHHGSQYNLTSEVMKDFCQNRIIKSGHGESDDEHESIPNNNCYPMLFVSYGCFNKPNLI